MVRKNRPFYHLRLGHGEGKDIKKQQKLHKHQEISYSRNPRISSNLYWYNIVEINLKLIPF